MNLVPRPLPHQTWCRAVQTAYSDNPLWWLHPDPADPVGPSSPKRFRAGGETFPLLHFARDENTALLEAQAITGAPNAARMRKGGWRTFRISISLDRVADFLRPSERRTIKTTVQELTGDWEGYRNRTASSLVASLPPAPTQKIGEALYSTTDFQAFLTPSAKNPMYPNLVVFPDRVRIDATALTIEAD